MPPPPKNPVRSPPARVDGEEEIVVEGPAGPIEARVRAPAEARIAVLLLHPHPLYGGSMHSPVPLAIAKTLAEKGSEVATLRFNFRGVGATAGPYDDGRGETEDALAALTELRRRAPRATPLVCGHSFGSWVGLRAASRRDDIERVALVAPSMRFFDWTAPSAERFSYAGRLAIFLGDHDEYCDVDEGRALAEQLRAELHVLEGFDHHFLKSRRAMAERVATFLEG